MKRAIRALVFSVGCYLVAVSIGIEIVSWNYFGLVLGLSIICATGLDE